MDTEAKEIIMIHPKVNPFAVKTAMDYRGFSQSKLCKNINGLSQPNLSKFLSGNISALSFSKLKEIMIFLDFPIDFIFKDIKPIKYYL